jgi:hypothetical protein
VRRFQEWLGLSISEGGRRLAAAVETAGHRLGLWVYWAFRTEERQAFDEKIDRLVVALVDALVRPQPPPTFPAPPPPKGMLQ